MTYLKLFDRNSSKEQEAAIRLATRDSIVSLHTWDKMSFFQALSWNQTDRFESNGNNQPVLKVKEESEKVALKLNIQKTKIMASGPITSWQIDAQTVADFVFWRSKITDFISGGSKIKSDCSHEIKRHFLLGRKIMTNLDTILKSRDITLSTNVHLVKVMVFPVVMYECESWTIRKLKTEELMLLNCGVGEDS